MLEVRNYNYNKLRGLIKEHCGTLANYAELIGISSTTLNTRLNNETFFNQEEIEKSILLFGVPFDKVNEIFFNSK